MEQYEGPLTPTEKALEQERAKAKRLELRLLEKRATMLYMRILDRWDLECDRGRFAGRWRKRTLRVLEILEATRKELANVNR